MLIKSINEEKEESRYKDMLRHDSLHDLPVPVKEDVWQDHQSCKKKKKKNCLRLQDFLEKYAVTVL